MPRPRLFLIPTFVLLAIGVSAEETAPGQEHADVAWQALRERRTLDADPAFDAALRPRPDDRTLLLGRAVALLNQQPRLRDNIARADSLLLSLQTTSDDVGLFACYLRARVAEVHLFEPDLPLAAQRYEDLIARAPAHLAAQTAAVKLVQLRIYRLGRDPAAALAAAEAWSDKLTEASARRDYHFVMARSYLFFKISPEHALRHFLAAREAGQLIPAQAAATLAGIAELARELKRPELAREAYADFLRTYRRDHRLFMIRQRLAELGDPASAADR